MRADITDFVARCQVCQQVRIEHQRPGGLVRSLPVPEWKWTDISMDFVTGLRRDVRGFDAIWVVVDRLTKSTHFIAIQETWPASRLAEEFIRQIVRLHGVPERIVSDRDGRFTSRFWHQVQEALGTRLHFSTAFHPQTDGQSERTIQTLEDMLRSCVLEWGDRWVRFLPLVEFSYNNSYHASIEMAPYEALYGRRCKSPVCWDEPADTVSSLPELVRETVDEVGRIREHMRVAQDRQKKYADRRKTEIEFEVGSHVWLRVSPTRGVRRFGIKGKLSPRYIGPFEILDRVGEVAYRLALPPSLAGVHDVFHVSQLRQYVPDPSHVLDYSDLQIEPDHTFVERPVRVLDRRVKRLRNREVPLLLVQWSRRSPEEATWETEESIRASYGDVLDKLLASYVEPSIDISLTSRVR